MRKSAGMVSIMGVLILAACQSQAPSPQPGGETPSVVPLLDPTADLYLAQREQLVQSGVIDWGIDDQAVIDVMRRVPRHLFVPDRYLNQAYENHPLPIGYGQTISQPYIVALMTQALEIGPGDVVLEVGAGSGYQAAVLAELAQQVYTIEIVGALAERASMQLAGLGYGNVEVVHADGYYGLEEHAPFDAIIVTAAPDHVPPPLQAQLADGGRLVIPVGPVGGYQELWLVERHGDKFTTTSLGGVSFVPLTRDVREE